MTSAAKAQKDKPHAPTPKLTPRPTAASTARAARNANNRNLTLTTASNRTSPNRSSPPVSTKGKSSVQRSLNMTPKSDSKADIVKNNHLADRDDLDNFVQAVSPTRESDLYVMENTTVMIISETVNDSTGQEICEPVLDIQENNESVYEIDRTEIPDESDNQSGDNKAEYTSKKHITVPQASNVSRPDTPKSFHSRPQTPRISSRPSTPAHPVQRPSTPNSRPNTPQRPPTRPRTPSSLSSPSPIRAQTPSSICSRTISPTKDTEEDIKTAFMAKQRQYNRLKKELDMKQQVVLEVYGCLKDLGERMTREGVVGASGEGVRELVVFNVADWASEEVAQLCCEATTPEVASELINVTVPIDENVLCELDAKVTDVPARFADLCLQAFTARQELIDWVKELIESNEIGTDESLERIGRYNAQGLQLCEALRELKSRSDVAMDTVTQLSKRTCRERAALISVGESLVREVARLRQDLEARTNILNEMRESSTESDLAKALEDTRRELEEVKNARAALKEKLSTTDSQLRQARTRITKMDRQLREAEASITSLTSTVKSLEDQSRQREVQLEARARKLKESLKTGEVASSQIAQQRDTLLAETQSLKEEIEKLTSEHKNMVQELNNQIKDLKSALEKQEQEIKEQTEMKNAAQASYTEAQTEIYELNTKITELENKKPNPELPTEREMDLWAELQATKETLRMTEDEINGCKREKVRFLESFAKIAESDNKIGMQQKLAAELLSKEEILNKMQTQIRELTKNIKLNEQKVIQYEQYVRDLQAHNRAVANCQEAPNGISYQDLQQEIMNLRMGLLEAVHRNEELSEMLVQKEQQLEQQDKTSRAQARVIKVREELINMLKNKETEQSRELAALQQDLLHRMKIVDDVNKQIAAKAEEIQELFATLENKQQQIHRLEKIVLALEEQQRRAQAQRTRHEEKIAALEHELAAGGNRRERGVTSREIYDLAAEEVTLRQKSLRDAALSYNLNYTYLYRYLKKTAYEANESATAPTVGYPEKTFYSFRGEGTCD